MQVLVPHMSCVCKSDELEEALAAGYKEVYLTTVGGGIFKHHQLRGTNRFIRLKVDSIPGFKEESLGQEICFLPAGKIPYALWEQVIGFFKKVIVVKKEELEAMIHILWNAEQGYHIGVPPQTVSKASASYEYGYIPTGTIIALDVHSHNSMNAFYSSTDNQDDRNSIGFSAVVGKINDKEPQVIVRFNYYTAKYDIKISDVIDMPVFPEVDIPDEWIAKVGTPAARGGYLGYQGKYPQYGNHPNPGANTPGLNRIDTKSNIVGGRLVAPGVSDYEPLWVKESRERAELAERVGEINGNRIGPGLRPQLGHTLSRHQPANQDRLIGINLHSGEIEDDQEYSLGELFGVQELANLNPVEQVANKVTSIAKQDALVGNTPARGVDDAEYAYLVIQHGSEIADAVTLMNDCMGAISGKPELLTEVVSDLFQLTEGDHQLEMIRRMCSELPSESRDKLMNSGL